MTSLTKAPTSPADLARISAYYKSAQKLVVQLAGRWLDESEYENIDDYKAVLEKQLPAGFAITRMTKRPFGFHFTIGTDAVYAITCSYSTGIYKWKRIG